MASRLDRPVAGEPRAPMAPTAAPGPLAGTAALALGLRACQRMRSWAVVGGLGINREFPTEMGLTTFYNENKGSPQHRGRTKKNCGLPVYPGKM